MLKLISPAKINLFLNIIKKRDDGYHELASLFQTINLYDTLEFEFSDKDELYCNDPRIPINSSNLIIKALDLFRKKTGLNFYLKIFLDKKIPHQAGLGGGSSNAATTLWAINALHGFPVDLQNLIEWSKEIGSDITFFFSEGTALCLGRGEIVIKQKFFQNTLSLYIVKPSIGLSTPEVFKALDPTTFEQKDLKVVLKKINDNHPEYFNDLEKAAFKVNPQLFVLKKRLIDSGFDSVTMTGSGSAFFCFGESKDPLNDLYVSKVAFIDRSPSEWYKIS